MRTINLERHNDDWSVSLKTETAVIKGILSDNFKAAYHIGSTAIKAIMAKPVIDILLEVRSIEEIDKLNKEFEKWGYEAKGEYGIKGRRFFQKGGDKRTHHIHAFESGSPEIERHNLFVEFMNAHPIEAARYEKLKIELAKKFKDDPNGYAEGKSSFIKHIDKKAIQWKQSL